MNSHQIIRTVLRVKYTEAFIIADGIVIGMYDSDLRDCLMPAIRCVFERSFVMGVVVSFNYSMVFRYTCLETAPFNVANAIVSRLIE